MFITGAGAQRNRAILSLAIIVLATLAITVPFAGQAFSVDGPEEIDFAQRQLDQPFAQDLPDYDHMGVKYESFFNTHPRFLSIYLSLVIRITGEPSEVPIHLSLAIFPLIGAIGMFYLGWRFKVSGFAAAMLFLASPMIMVNAHTEMVDLPGSSLIIAAVALFIFAVDKRSNWLLALSTLMMILATQTFFQGLVVLPLAMAYLVINRQYRLRNFIPIISAGLFFAGYLLAVLASYGHLPRFSHRKIYRFDRQTSYLALARGNLTVLGGTVLFPFVALFGFLVRWTSALVFIGASVITWSWSLVKYALGENSFSDMLLLSIMLPVGITVAYLIFERFLANIFSYEKRHSRAGKDTIFLAVWFIGVLAYAVFVLPYPAPRYLLPAAPAVILSLLIIWRGIIKRSWLRFCLVAGAMALTIVFSTMLSLTYFNIANNSKRAAEWAFANYGDKNRVWYNATFGFGFYMKRYGFRLTPNVLNELNKENQKPLALDQPQPGDYAVYSIQNGAWVPYPSVMQRLRFENDLLLYNRQLFSFPCSGTGTCWWGAMFLPFKIDLSGEVTDVVMVWRIDEEPNPLAEGQKELYREVGITWIDEISEKTMTDEINDR